MNYSNALTRALCVWIAVLHVCLTTGLSTASAQSVSDNTAPVVDLQLVESGALGDTQVFSATVTDDNGVSEVVLFYRLTGASAYTRAPMLPIAGTSIYTVAVEPEANTPTTIEYYINAADTSNNRVVRGYSFDPLVRELVGSGALASGSQQPAAEAPADPVSVPAPGLSTGQKVLYVALGVLAVGALAAAASGGNSNDGGSSNPGGGPTIPVTILVDSVASEFD